MRSTGGFFSDVMLSYARVPGNPSYGIWEVPKWTYVALQCFSLVANLLEKLFLIFMVVPVLPKEEHCHELTLNSKLSATGISFYIKKDFI
jgi:hypothetical protein